MTHIPTTATKVETLKKQAKARSRASGLPLHEVLNLIAVEAGYTHWKHVTLCAKATTAIPSAANPQTALPLMEEFGHLLSAEDLAELDAVSGSDRNFWLLQIIKRYPEGAARFRTLSASVSASWSNSIAPPRPKSQIEESPLDVIQAINEVLNTLPSTEAAAQQLLDKYSPKVQQQLINGIYLGRSNLHQTQLLDNVDPTVAATDHIEPKDYAGLLCEKVSSLPLYLGTLTRCAAASGFDLRDM